jgi:hypothetical protein
VELDENGLRGSDERSKGRLQWREVRVQRLL